MEEDIKQYFCSLCNNKYANCMQVSAEKKSNGLLSYKCLNYQHNPLAETNKYYFFNYKIKSDVEGETI